MSEYLQDKSKLSPVGRCLIDHRDDVLHLWEQRLRKDVPSAKHLLHPILVDTVPMFLNNVAEALTPGFPRTNATDLSTIAQEHGGERVRVTQYAIDHLISEYQILQEAILEVLERHIELTPADTKVIHNSLDQAVKDAVTAFALVQSNIREQFVATLSHDIRNPLNAAVMAADLILEDPENVEQTVFLGVKIRENLKRIERMTRDLLDVTLARAGGRIKLTLQECDMLAIVNNVVDRLSVERSRIVVRGKPVQGIWSADTLDRAVENLLTNALKFGDLAPIVVSVSEAHDRVIVSVHNEGGSIPVADQEYIFQVYRRNEANKTGHKGWGIGLSLVRGVAESHGGSIQVDSAPDRGTTFTIDIPQDARPFQEAPVTVRRWTSDEESA